MKFIIINEKKKKKPHSLPTATEAVVQVATAQWAQWGNSECERITHAPISPKSAANELAVLSGMSSMAGPPLKPPIRFGKERDQRERQKLSLPKVSKPEHTHTPVLLTSLETASPGNAPRTVRRLHTTGFHSFSVVKHVTTLNLQTKHILYHSQVEMMTSHTWLQVKCTFQWRGLFFPFSLC